MKKSLRLLVWEHCNRNCDGCCNKDIDLNKLQVITDYTGYDEILITGGEPLLYPKKIINIVYNIGIYNPTAKIYVYTAYTDDVAAFYDILGVTDGITLTLHEQSDVNENFRAIDTIVKYMDSKKSLRLNVFKGIDVGDISNKWKVKDNIVWIENLSLPPNEVFGRYE